ncbi:MAG: hypothetical protein QUT30_04850 [Acidobacteriota bacterium]|nr:hypothetical protein [Acidobacteriota bacterium]
MMLAGVNRGIGKPALDLTEAGIQVIAAIGVGRVQHPPQFEAKTGKSQGSQYR